MSAVQNVDGAFLRMYRRLSRRLEDCHLGPHPSGTSPIYSPNPAFATEGVCIVQVVGNQADHRKGLHQTSLMTQRAGSTNSPLAVIRGGG